jgi:hypothetical protein
MSSPKYKGHSTSSSNFVPLDLEQRTHVDTASAAYHLGRKAQTMRVWASTEQGPIRPVRINGRLAWPIAEIRKVLKCPSLMCVELR